MDGEEMSLGAVGGFVFFCLRFDFLLVFGFPLDTFSVSPSLGNIGSAADSAEAGDAESAPN